MTKKSGTNKSRRDFLKGSLLAGGAGLALGVTGCTPKVAETPAVETPATGLSFLNVPAAINAGEIKETFSADVVVVGAGVCGLMAAYTAAKEGAKTILLEKWEKYNARGGHNAALRSKIQLEEGLDYDPARVVAELTKWANNNVDVAQEMAWAAATKRWHTASKSAWL